MSAPKEPGEIGWHANADSPDIDYSLPEAGSGGAKLVVPDATPPNDDYTVAEPEVVPEPEVVEPEVVAEPAAETPVE